MEKEEFPWLKNQLELWKEAESLKYIEKVKNIK